MKAINFLELVIVVVIMCAGLPALSTVCALCMNPTTFTYIEEKSEAGETGVGFGSYTIPSAYIFSNGTFGKINAGTGQVITNCTPNPSGSNKTVMSNPYYWMTAQEMSYGEVLCSYVVADEWMPDDCKTVYFNNTKRTYVENDYLLKSDRLNQIIVPALSGVTASKFWLRYTGTEWQYYPADKPVIYTVTNGR